MAKKLSEKQARMAQQRKEQRRAQAQAARKKKRRKKILTTTGICTAAVVLIAGATVWTIQTKPLTHYLTIGKTTHYKLNAAEISFYTWQIYQQYMESASDSSDVPDTDTPLSEQNYDSDTTWEAYFVQAGCDYAENVLVLCEAAYGEDYEASYDITAEAEESLDYFDLETVPDFITDEDIISAMEKYMYASDYYDYLFDTIEPSDDELEAYYTENATSMQVCSYISYSFTYDDSGTGYLTSADANDLASELRRCTTQEEFEQWVTDYYKENTTTMTDEEIASSVSSLYSENMSYIEGDEISEWVFSEGLKAGDTTILTDEEDSTLTVCMLVSEPERDETCPISLRQVLFTASSYDSVEEARSQAESVLAEWESGEQTEESFATLADTYSEDTSTSGGLYTDVTQGELFTSWKQWLFADERQSGDVTILESSYYVALIYYVGAEDMSNWEMIATEALTEEIYNETYETYEEQAQMKFSDSLTGLIQVVAE